MVIKLRKNIFIIIVTFFVTFLVHVPSSLHMLCTCEQSKTGNNERYERFQFSCLSAPFQYALNRQSSSLQDQDMLLTDSDVENAQGVYEYIYPQHQIDMKNTYQTVMNETRKNLEITLSPYMKEIAHITDCQHCISLFLCTIIQNIDIWETKN